MATADTERAKIRGTGSSGFSILQPTGTKTFSKHLSLLTSDAIPTVTSPSGQHFCLGANLVRLELQVMLGRPVARLESFELAGEIERMYSMLLAA
jgi:cytochrome P450